MYRRNNNYVQVLNEKKAQKPLQTPSETRNGAIILLSVAHIHWRVNEKKEVYWDFCVRAHYTLFEIENGAFLHRITTHNPMQQ